jgi:hypothetical protein
MQNDAITWLLDKAWPDQRNPTDLTRRMLVLNLAAMHTTSLVSYTETESHTWFTYPLSASQDFHTRIVLFGGAAGTCPDLA